MKKVLSLILALIMIISVLPLGAITALSNTIDNAISISVGETIQEDGSGGVDHWYSLNNYYMFSPSENGVYKLYCSYCSITQYDSSGNPISGASDYDSLTFYACVGTTYYFLCRGDKDSKGYTVSLNAVNYGNILQGKMGKVDYSMDFETGEFSIEYNSDNKGSYCKYIYSDDISWWNSIRSITVRGNRFRVIFYSQEMNLDRLTVDVHYGYVRFNSECRVGELNIYDGDLYGSGYSAENLYIYESSEISFIEATNVYYYCCYLGDYWGTVICDNLYLESNLDEETAFEVICYSRPNRIELGEECSSLIKENNMILSADRSCLVYAFSRNENFEVPKDIDTIMSSGKSSALDGLRSVESYTVEKGNVSFKAKDGVLFDSYLRKLIKYPRCASAKSYEIPESVKALENGAFCDVWFLEDLYIPSSINTDFRYSVYYFCDYIIHVNVGSYAHRLVESSFDEDEYVVEYNDALSISETEELLKYYTLRNNGRTVRKFTPDKTGEYLFKVKKTNPNQHMEYNVCVYDNESKSAVDSRRGWNDYSKNISTQSFYLEEGKTYYFSFGIGSYSVAVGDYTISLEESNGENNIEVYKNSLYYSLDNDTKTAAVVGPSSDHFSFEILPKTNGCFVTAIDDYAFKGCSDMVCEINIPSTVQSIGKGAFADCNNLQSVNIDEGNEYLKFVDGVLFNADITELIWYPNYLENSSYTVPSTVQVINGGAFYGNKNLKTVTLPSSLVVIEEEAFQNTKIREIELPSSVRFIGKNAFYATPLKEIDIPQSVEEVQDEAFGACEYLTKATIRNQQMNFGKEVFRYNVEITGYTDSTAEAYANSNYMSFIDIEHINDESQNCEHNWVDISRTQASCVASGIQVCECSVCGAQKAEIIPIQEHTFVEEKHDATPNSQGYTKYTCPICSYAYVSDITPYASDVSALEAAIAQAHYYSKSKLPVAQIQSIVDEAQSYNELAQTNAPQAEYDYAVGEILTAIESADEYAKYEPIAINADVVSIMNENGEVAEMSFEENINEYSAPLDVVKDGIINAKDFAYIIRNY